MIILELFFLEEKLIDKINLGYKKDALYSYEELFNYFSTYDLGNGCPIRSIKNHLVLLTQCLYENFCKDIICKYNLYQKRNAFVLNFEKSESIDELYRIGKEMILYYSNTAIEKCICVNNPIVKEALNYIHSHIDEDLSLEKIAKEIHISKNHLSCLFRQCTGYSFSNYINHIKIETSKTLLKNSKKSILEIAIECGFNSESYFCSTFKKLIGVTPTEYRNHS